MDSTEKSKIGTVTGARALVDALLREGVDHVFGIPGTQNLAIIDALRDTPQIRFILTRHEQGAAFMAYGFARAGLRPAVVTATEGPGVTNLATAIGAAHRGLVPVISICGVQESVMRERDATQDMDQVTFMKPITKWAYSIPNVKVFCPSPCPAMVRWCRTSRPTTVSWCSPSVTWTVFTFLRHLRSFLPYTGLTVSAA